MNTTARVRLSDEQIDQIRDEYSAHRSVTAVAKRLGLTWSTVAKYVDHTVRERTKPTPAALDNTWQDRAACRGYEPETFFPSGAKDADLIDQAKAICSGCPVTAACLAWAKATKSEGVWGGKYLGYSGHRDGAERVG